MKRNILYVDDELDNVIVFQAGLEDDFNVWTANSGDEALKVMQRVQFPVVVADQRMPEMSGVELFEIIREKYPFTQRVILTGYIDSAAMMDAINKGQVFSFVTKPWDRSFLMSVLLRAIETHDMKISNSALTERLVASERCATLGRVAVQVAHEMSNQLGALPLLELIEENYGDHEDLVTMAQFAKQTHERLMTLVNEVKQFVRFEQSQLNRQTVKLDEVLHELFAFLRFDKEIRQDILRLSVKSQPVVVADRMKVQQVVLNLIKNAVHATRDREAPLISVCLSETGSFAEITVADNGTGINPEVIDRIWDPFFSTKGAEGTGLGLDISRNLVEGYGGSIRCTSSPGEGSLFEVQLPLAEEAAASSGAVESQNAAFDPSGAVGGLRYGLK